MISPLAHVHPEAVIGNNVTIEPFSIIYKDVTIGDGTWIGPNVVIMDGARIGKNCKIFPGAVIAGTPQDLKFQGEVTTAEIGDNTTIREFATINRGTNAKKRTIVGSNCLIMAYVHVAHDCTLGNNVILVNYVGLAGEVEVGDYAILSGSTVVHQFCRIGKHVMITGGSLVRKDVPPFTLAAREPLAYVGINKVGLRRRNFTNDQIFQIQDIYRLLYQKGLNNSAALELIEKEIPPSADRDEVVNFVRNSKRGIMKGFNGNFNPEDIG
jgi:UDP-N-acetylglucosamine acyltransferase